MRAMKLNESEEPKKRRYIKEAVKTRDLYRHWDRIRAGT